MSLNSPNFGIDDENGAVAAYTEANEKSRNVLAQFVNNGPQFGSNELFDISEETFSQYD